MAHKLPVFRTAGLAFKSVFAEPVLFSKFFLKGFLIFFLAKEAVGFVNGFFRTLDNPAVFSITELPLWFVIAPIGVALHRFIIIGDELPSKPFRGFLSHRNLEFGFIGMLFYIPAMVALLAPQI